MTSRSPRRLPRWVLPLACAVAGLAVFQVWGNAARGYIHSPSLFVWWSFQWTNPGSECEQGWVLLAISAVLFARNLRRFGDVEEDAAGGGANAAAAAMAGGLALHVLGFFIQQTRLSILALLVFLWGAARLAGGGRWSRAAAFPLALMLFAIPTGLVDAASFWLRLGVIDASHALARLGGVAVVRSGTQLFSPDGRYQFDVVAACSGIRSLQAMAALSLLCGYLYLRGWAGRIGVFLLAMPYAVAGNVVRVTAILYAAHLWGRPAGVWVHEKAGFLVWLVVGGLLAVTVWAVRRWENRGATEARPADDAPAQAAAKAGGISDPGTARAGMAVLGAVVVASGALAWLARHAPQARAGVVLAPGGRDPVSLPTFLGTDWGGRREEVTALEREVLPPDTGFSRELYYSLVQPGQGVLVSVVLSGADRSSLHRPELCLLAQGWSVGRSRIYRFSDPISGAQGPLEATVVDVSKVYPGLGSRPRPGLVAYWFVGADETVASTTGRLWRDAVARLTGRPERWAYVLMQTGADDGEAAALKRIQGVIDGVVPVLVAHPAPAGTGGAGPE